MVCSHHNLQIWCLLNLSKIIAACFPTKFIILFSAPLLWYVKYCHVEAFNYRMCLSKIFEVVFQSRISADFIVVWKFSAAVTTAWHSVLSSKVIFSTNFPTVFTFNGVENVIYIYNVLDCSCICLVSAFWISRGKVARFHMEYLCRAYLVTVRVIQTVTFER